MRVKIGTVIIELLVHKPSPKEITEDEKADASILLARKIIKLKDALAVEVEIQRLQKLKGKGND